MDVRAGLGECSQRSLEKTEEIELHRTEAEEEAERVKAELVNGSLLK